MEVTEKIKTQPSPKLIWALSAPAVLPLLVNALNTAINGIFVAKSVGITALSVITVSFGVILIIQVMSMLVAAGASASISLKLGKSDKTGAKKIMSIGAPASIVQFTLSLVSLIFNHVAAFYGGTVGVAAYEIMYNKPC